MAEVMMEKISNENHESDMNYAVQYTKWLLTLLGVWPLIVTNTTRIGRYAATFWLPFPSTISLTILIPMICHVAVRKLSREELIAIVGPISAQSIIVIKNVILISRYGIIKFCIKHMASDWRRVENGHERDIMMKNLKVGRRLTIISVAVMSSGVLFFNTKTLFSSPYVNHLNQSVRPLTAPGADIFVDLQHGSNYEIVYIINSVGYFFTNIIVNTTCNLAAVFVTHAVGQIQIVMSRLDGLVDKNENTNDVVNFKSRIAFIVQNHVRVTRFVSRADEILRYMCLMEVANSTLVMCSVEYYCVMEWHNSNFLPMMTYFGLFVSLCFNLFILCHIGELLKDQCQKIGRVSYSIDWHKLPDKSALSLCLIISMANYPCQLTAGQMMELSYYSFGSIIKASFAYLNMMRTMAE